MLTRYEVAVQLSLLNLCQPALDTVLHLNSVVIYSIVASVTCVDNPEHPVGITVLCLTS
jgi:hypothetical protein